MFRGFASCCHSRRKPTALNRPPFRQQCANFQDFHTTFHRTCPASTFRRRSIPHIPNAYNFGPIRAYLVASFTSALFLERLMHSRSTRRAAAGLAFALALGTLGTAYAADVNGRIRGTITDPQDAVLPNIVENQRRWQLSVPRASGRYLHHLCRGIWLQSIQGDRHHHQHRPGVC